jgi:CO/xanthine dehydrogenase FAD-binding subunit
MVAVNLREQPLEVVIHLGRTGLDYIRPAEDRVVIGATTTHAEIARSSTVREEAQLLAEAVRSIGSPAIRNVGTIGGNIANASPGADGAVALLALGAKVKLVSVRGERVVDLDRFFTGYGETLMQADELLEEVIIPARKGTCRWRWRKVGQRKAGVCAVISVAVALQLEGGVCTRAGIALGTAAPTPALARWAGEILEGRRLDAPIREEAARTATEALSDRDGSRATAWYRRRLCETLVKRFLAEISAEEGR